MGDPYKFLHENFNKSHIFSHMFSTYSFTVMLISESKAVLRVFNEFPLKIQKQETFQNTFSRKFLYNPGVGTRISRKENIKEFLTQFVICLGIINS